MTTWDHGLIIIMVLLLGIIWELDRIREHTESLREITSRGASTDLFLAQGRCHGISDNRDRQ